MSRPDTSEYKAFYETYVSLVPEDDILPILKSEIERTVEFLGGVSEAESLLHHAPYTWSIRQVVGHLIDCERVFAYRALRIGRNDVTPLPGFDENVFAEAGDFDKIALKNLVKEFVVVRQNSLFLFEHFPQAAWTRKGTANDSPVSVRALAHILVGHERHHMGIVRRRLSK